MMVEEVVMIEVPVEVLVPMGLVSLLLVRAREAVVLVLVRLVRLVQMLRQNRRGCCWKGWHSGSTSGTGMAWCG